jgi:hypothetical protein
MRKEEKGGERGERRRKEEKGGKGGGRRKEERGRDETKIRKLRI